MSEDTPTIDPRNNPESQQNEEGASQTGTRTGQGGVTMSDAPTTEEGAHGVIDGRVTGANTGDMLAGVRATEEDSEEVVSGDTGPEHPGRRDG